MISSVATLDIKVNATVIASYSPAVKGDARSAMRFLSVLRMECEQRRMAWQVYRSVKKEAKKLGLIPR